MTRTAFAETPPRVVYELTPVGHGLGDVLEAMRRWGDALPPDVLDERDSDTPPEAPGAALGAAMSACPFGGAAAPSAQARRGTGKRGA